MTDLGGVVPKEGGRVQFKLLGVRDGAAEYAVHLSAEGRKWAGSWQFGGGKPAATKEIEGDPPVWLLEFARAVARTFQRQAEDAEWPRRVTRWRAGPPRGR